MAVRFGLYSPSPQDRTAFTVRTNFTDPEGLDYFHQKVWRGCNVAVRFGLYSQQWLSS